MPNLAAVVLVLAALGVAFSLGLATVRSNFPVLPHRRVPRAAIIWVFPLAFAVMMMLALAIGDTRRIPDALAVRALFLVPIAVVVALSLDVFLQRRRNTSRLRVAVKVAIALLVAAGLIWLGIGTGDFFIPVFLSAVLIPLAGGLGGLIALLIALVLRRARIARLGFLSSMVSMGVVTTVAIVILVAPERLVESADDISLSPALPRAAGWSQEGLETAFDYAQDLGSSSVIVLHDGAIVAEWGDTGRRISAHSVRKSLLSALYGIAVERGMADTGKTLESMGVDDSPKLTSEEKSAQLRDLLKSRSGIYHDSVKVDEDDRPERGTHPPDAFFYYNNWSFNALGGIFEQQTSLTMGQAFKEWIADPIGMQDFRVEDVRYETSDESVFPAFRFWMTARDLARFGLLFQRCGEWEGQQVIRCDWIEESTSTYSTIGNGYGYGYMWWTTVDVPTWLSKGSYFASGTGGQKLLVDTDRKLVIVHRVDTGRNVTRALWWDYGAWVSNGQFMELARLIIGASPGDAQ